MNTHIHIYVFIGIYVGLTRNGAGSLIAIRVALVGARACLCAG